MTSVGGSHLQPLLDRAVIALRAPTQVWSDVGGDMGEHAIEGVYHGDVRHIGRLRLSCPDSPIEWISTGERGADAVTFIGLLRGIDDAGSDPRVRLVRERVVAAGRLTERLLVANRTAATISTSLEVRLDPEFGSMQDVKAGLGPAAPLDLAVVDDAVVASSGTARTVVRASGAELAVESDQVVLRWPVTVAAGAEVRLHWSLDLGDDSLVVQAPTSPAPWTSDGRLAALLADAGASDPRGGRWLRTALGDLDALRLCLPEHPDDQFYAAGAPWFLTLFGRDSLWAARLLLPADLSIAASTLRVLARLQGRLDDPATAQQPGKILHELRSAALTLPGEGVELPPLYYGTVDATPLWVCLLVDAWRAGLDEDQVRALLPSLDAALRWIIEFGDADGDGFLDYQDQTGRGLANQGWKDSGDSIQWRDGRIAEGPIALCEVQAYAYEAATGAADLLDALGVGEAGTRPAELRRWAADLRARFRRTYWVETVEGRYPAIALDRHKRPVDSLTSNIGHLIGTGLLDPAEETGLAALLLGPSLSSGYGIRTLSKGASGYWPLSYHGGSVWTHDTAIAIFGLSRAGLHQPARRLAEQLLVAAEAFGWRVPELHGGDADDEVPRPTPYPAACRPQAWAAAAAVTATGALVPPR
jgi:glycogen debranching enzyme